MKPADEELELTRSLAAETDLADPDIALLRERGPDATELASLASRLALQGVDVSPTTTSTSAIPRLRWALAGAGGASALLLWLALRATPPVPAQPVVPPAERVTSTQDAAPRGSETPSSSSPARAVTGSSAPATPITVLGAEGEAPAPRAAQEAEPPDAELRPSPDPASPTSPPTFAGPSARPSLGGVASSRPAGPAELAPAPTAAPSEIELLRDARFALKQSPARALELTDQHARLYPAGKLTQERELIAITALVSLGRRTAALSRGASFERAFPRSAYREQISDLLR